MSGEYPQEPAQYEDYGPNGEYAPYAPAAPGPQDNPAATLNQYLRLVAGALGVGIIIVGLAYFITVLNRLIGILGDPISVEAQVQAVYTLIHGEDLVAPVNGQTIAFGYFAAAGVFGLGGLVLLSGCATLIRAGVGIINLSTTDNETIKRVFRDFVRQIHLRRQLSEAIFRQDSVIPREKK